MKTVKRNRVRKEADGDRASVRLPHVNLAMMANTQDDSRRPNKADAGDNPKPRVNVISFTS